MGSPAQYPAIPIYACAVNGRARDAATGLAVSLALALGSCGDDGGGDGGTTATEPGRLSAAEAETIVAAQEAVGRYCARIAERGGAPPSAGEFDRVTGALDELAALARRKPERRRSVGGLGAARPRRHRREPGGLELRLAPRRADRRATRGAALTLRLLEAYSQLWAIRSRLRPPTQRSSPLLPLSRSLPKLPKSVSSPDLPLIRSAPRWP